MKITEETRRESYEKLDAETIRKQVIKMLEGGREMTAREIALALHEKQCVPYPVRQAVAPRLTELVEDGRAEVCGKAYDSETGRSVALYRLVADE